jgi:hypothetical protein
VIRPDLDDGDVGVVRDAEQREGYTNLVIQVTASRVDREARAERRGREFFRARLAVRAGHRHDRLAPGAPPIPTEHA